MTSALNGIAVAVVVKVTFTTALGLTGAWLARGKRASLRHALLAASFGVASLLPIAVVLMPPSRIPVPAEAESWAPVLPVMSDVDAAQSATTSGTRARVTAEAPRSGSKLSWADVSFVAWGSGVALFLLPVIAGLCHIRAFRRSGLPWRQGQSIVESLALRAGFHRRVEVLLHDTLPGPMTCGVLHPVIVLPRDAETWNPDDLNRAMVHELEHVRRGDSITRCLARAVCAVYWFHPLVWIAWRKLGLESERACDDAVLGDSEGTAYADQLIELAKRMSSAQRLPILAMASRADLAARVGALLDDRQQRGPCGISRVAIACAVAVVLVIGVSPLGLVAAPQTASAGTLSFDAASVKVVTVPRGVTLIEGGGIMTRKGKGSDPGRVASTGGPGTDDPGRIHYPLVNLKELVRLAWSSYFEIEGPGWLSTRIVAVDATMPPDTTQEQFQEMLRNLIISRFGFKYHTGTKQVTGYALVVTKSGPKMKESDDQSNGPMGTAPPMTKRGPDGFPTFAVQAGRWCVSMENPGDRSRTICQQQTIQDLSQAFGRLLKTVVTDETGLTAKYDFTLTYGGHYEPGRALSPPRPASAPDTADADAAEPLPDIFSALQSQLGLKLEEKKVDVPVIVVDRMARTPSGN